MAIRRRLECRQHRLGGLAQQFERRVGRHLEQDVARLDQFAIGELLWIGGVVTRAGGIVGLRHFYFALKQRFDAFIFVLAQHAQAEAVGFLQQQGA